LLSSVTVTSYVLIAPKSKPPHPRPELMHEEELSNWFAPKKFLPHWLRICTLTF